MLLETIDGTAILGYAGLGATALGTQPADWMSTVLRGRNLPLEQSLSVLAEAMRTHFPRHLIQMPEGHEPGHTVLITAFLGDEPRLYTIDLVVAPDRKHYRFTYTRRLAGTPRMRKPRTPRIGLAGTGGSYLMSDKRWIRGLLDLVKASDRRRVAPDAVSDRLAALNHEVHKGIADNSVGPSCIVAWRSRKGGIHKGGGGHLFYVGASRESGTPAIPTIGQGMDIAALVGVLMPHVLEVMDEMTEGKPAADIDVDQLNEELSRLPDEPNEELP
jgi:hypothetical protein